MKANRPTAALVLHGTEDQIVEAGADGLLLMATGSTMAAGVAVDVGTWAQIHCTNADDAAKKSRAAIDCIRDRAITFGVKADTIGSYLSDMKRIAVAVALGQLTPTEEDVSMGLRRLSAQCPKLSTRGRKPKAAEPRDASPSAPVGTAEGFADDLHRFAVAIRDDVAAPSAIKWMARNPLEALSIIQSYMLAAENASKPAERKLRRAA